jgi:hypothetical protein
MIETDIRPHIDHVFVTVDRTVIDDVIRTPYLSESVFGRYFEKNAVSTLLGPYQTFNITGRNTCIELFDAEKAPFPGVRVGVVMTFDHVGESPVAQERLEALGISCHTEQIRRQVPGHEEPQPWYRLLRPVFGEGSAFTLFLSEIRPEYFDRLGAKRGENGSQDREAYLEAALKRPHLPEYNFEDIVGVGLRLRPEQAQLLERILVALGYEARNGQAGVRLSGPDVRLEVATSDGPEGLVSLELALARPHDGEPAYEFGRGCSLSFVQGAGTPPRALWRFPPAFD